MDSYVDDVTAFFDIATAHIGLDLLKPINFNNKYAAFATNKLHQFMAAGSPTVARNDPGYDELVKLLGTGICVDIDSSEQIASSVNQILGNENTKNNFGLNGRYHQLNWFNYEKQFKPVLERIMTICE